VSAQREGTPVCGCSPAAGDSGHDRRFGGDVPSGGTARAAVRAPISGMDRETERARRVVDRGGTSWPVNG